MSEQVVFNAEPLGYSEKARALWRTVGAYHEGDIDDPATFEVLARTTVLIVRLLRRIDGRVLERCPRLRTVVCATTGLDHLDLELMQERGIDILSLRGETEFLGTIPSTAEHAVALMLSLLRNIVPASASVIKGEWQRDRFRGRQLRDRRLGLVGLGRTGSMVAGYAAAFGMHIAYYDPNVFDHRFQRFSTLRELLLSSEIISLHVHLNGDTRAMIGTSELECMADGGWLINTSRGGLLDEHAVAEHIRRGRLAGAAVDVLDGELDGITTSPLWQAMRDGHNVLITPHLGGATGDAMRECEEFLAAKFVRSRVG